MTKGNKDNIRTKEFGEPLTRLTVKEVNELAQILKAEYGIEPAAAAIAIASPASEEAKTLTVDKALEIILDKVKQYVISKKNGENTLPEKNDYQTNTDEIVESLVAVTFSKFEKAAIARRIALLTEMKNDNFAFPEDYEDEERILFEQFKSLSPDMRLATLDKLNIKLDGASL